MACLTMLSETKTQTSLPFKEYAVGIYRENKKIVVRKFEIIGGIKVPIDEQYALNIEDAIVIQNLLIHKIHNYQLN